MDKCTIVIEGKLADEVTMRMTVLLMAAGLTKLVGVPINTISAEMNGESFLSRDVPRTAEELVKEAVSYL